MIDIPRILNLLKEWSKDLDAMEDELDDLSADAHTTKEAIDELLTEIEVEYKKQQELPLNNKEEK